MIGDIAVGSPVQYTGTGTIGEVKRIDQRDHERWICVDNTSLWYNAEILEVVRYMVERKGLKRELTLNDPKRAEKPKR